MTTLIRTEHIGLGAYLTKRRVLEARPECTYRYRTQTVKHILIFCPERQEARRKTLQRGRDIKLDGPSQV
ncbi:hypothetical protein M433DRAFT_160171 [Acidomyces richmondensis BFW]|nr:MAG: hypothetical protein FE78DRAFT_90064 [Acidomyces sp. 'richmondensis']KYG40609.1 hypothetical protein M433DRAFT_160171 [Acidomyces richmondensis BFW]